MYVIRKVYGMEMLTNLYNIFPKDDEHGADVGSLFYHSIEGPFRCTSLNPITWTKLELSELGVGADAKLEDRDSDIHYNVKHAYHTHMDERGMLVKCYHESKSVVLSIGFWFGTLIAFPLEHFIWEHIPPFSLLTKLLGL
jgi:hypothetical protein